MPTKTAAVLKLIERVDVWEGKSGCSMFNVFFLNFKSNPESRPTYYYTAAWSSPVDVVYNKKDKLNVLHLYYCQQIAQKN